jgi:cytochrome c-type biogenesis protein CcmH
MRFLMILALMLMPTSVLAVDADEMFTDPSQEARAREIGRQLRCLKCRNQSIFDSNASIAKDLRIVVRDRMRAGDSDAEVLDYIYERYGDYVLLNPRVSGQTAVLWATPLALLVLSGIGMAFYLRGRSKAKPDAQLCDEDRSAAQALLRGTEG